MNYLEEHYDEIFPRYSEDQLLTECRKFMNGGGTLSKLINHYFKEDVFKCKSNKYGKSPYEALQCTNDMEWILSYINRKKSFYNSKSEWLNVQSFFRNGTRIARKVSVFSAKNARNAYFRYHDAKNIVCLDTSCGFGTRMAASLLSGAKYIGFDPNEELCGHLNDMGEFLVNNKLINDDSYKIYNCGSEVFREELVGIADVAFTSPPYFNLETYAADAYGSTKNYNDYSLWLREFAEKTIDNTIRYLKVGGYISYNIKNMTNMGKQKLFDDFMRILSGKENLEFVEVYEVENGKKYYFQNCNYEESSYNGFKEPVMVFRKVSE